MSPIADRSGNVSTVWTEDGVLVGHVDIDVRVVVGRRYANALELLRPDADLRNCDVIPES